MSDIGEGLDQPIMEKDDMCIFETDKGYVMRQFDGGDLLTIPEDVSDAFWDTLRKEGWKDVEY